MRRLGPLPIPHRWGARRRSSSRPGSVCGDSPLRRRSCSPATKLMPTAAARKPGRGRHPQAHKVSGFKSSSLFFCLMGTYIGSHGCTGFLFRFVTAVGAIAVSMARPLH